MHRFLRPAAALLLAAAGGSAAAGDCSAVNWQCEAAADPTLERAGRATVMLRFPDASQCTGTLVNNSTGDGRPLILTARHCGGGVDDATLAERAGGVVIHWQRESACGSTRITDTLRTTGAIHRAAWQDAWLIEALDPAPDTAHFAGFDARGTLSSATAFGIHHGNGGGRQLVRQQPASGNTIFLGLGNLGIVASTWHTRLQQGSTPFGASGSALFDEQARVIGALTAGVACAGDVGGNDYQQLAVAWAGGGSPDTALAPWLDPSGGSKRVVAGRDAKTLPADAAGVAPPPAAAAPVSDHQGTSAGGGATAPGLLALLLLAGLLRRRTARL